jgi:hypothetical protein
MSLYLVDGLVLAINGIPVDLGTAPTLHAPVPSISSIDQETPSDDLTIEVALSSIDAGGTAIILHFFVPGTARATLSRTVANEAATVEVTLPMGFLLAGETLWCTAATDGAIRSNPSAPVSLLFDPVDTGGALPATLPFNL